MNSSKAASNGVYVESLMGLAFAVVTRFLIIYEDIVDEQLGQLGFKCPFGVVWRHVGRDRAELSAQMEWGQSIWPWDNGYLSRWYVYSARCHPGRAWLL